MSLFKLSASALSFRPATSEVNAQYNPTTSSPTPYAYAHSSLTGTAHKAKRKDRQTIEPISAGNSVSSPRKKQNKNKKNTAASSTIESVPVTRVIVANTTTTNNNGNTSNNISVRPSTRGSSRKGPPLFAGVVAPPIQCKHSNASHNTCTDVHSCVIPPPPPAAPQPIGGTCLDSNTNNTNNTNGISRNVCQNDQHTRPLYVPTAPAPVSACNDELLGDATTTTIPAEEASAVHATNALHTHTYDDHDRGHDGPKGCGPLTLGAAALGSSFSFSSSYCVASAMGAAGGLTPTPRSHYAHSTKAGDRLSASPAGTSSLFPSSTNFYSVADANAVVKPFEGASIYFPASSASAPSAFSNPRKHQITCSASPYYHSACPSRRDESNNKDSTIDYYYEEEGSTSASGGDSNISSNSGHNNNSISKNSKKEEKTPLHAVQTAVRVAEKKDKRADASGICTRGAIGCGGDGKHSSKQEGLVRKKRADLEEIVVRSLPISPSISPSSVSPTCTVAHTYVCEKGGFSSAPFSSPSAHHYNEAATTTAHHITSGGGCGGSALTMPHVLAIPPSSSSCALANIRSKGIDHITTICNNNNSNNNVCAAAAAPSSSASDVCTPAAVCDAASCMASCGGGRRGGGGFVVTSKRTPTPTAAASHPLSFSPLPGEAHVDTVAKGVAIISISPLLNNYNYHSDYAATVANDSTTAGTSTSAFVNGNSSSYMMNLSPTSSIHCHHQYTHQYKQQRPHHHHSSTLMNLPPPPPPPAYDDAVCSSHSVLAPSSSSANAYTGGTSCVTTVTAAAFSKNNTFEMNNNKNTNTNNNNHNNNIYSGVCTIMNASIISSVAKKQGSGDNNASFSSPFVPQPAPSSSAAVAVAANCSSSLHSSLGHTVVGNNKKWGDRLSGKETFATGTNKRHPATTISSLSSGNGNGSSIHRHSVSTMNNSSAATAAPPVTSTTTTTSLLHPSSVLARQKLGKGSLPAISNPQHYLAAVSYFQKLREEAAAGATSGGVSGGGNERRGAAQKEKTAHSGGELAGSVTTTKEGKEDGVEVANGNACCCDHGADAGKEGLTQSETQKDSSEAKSSSLNNNGGIGGCAERADPLSPHPSSSVLPLSPSLSDDLISLLSPEPSREPNVHAQALARYARFISYYDAPRVNGGGETNEVKSQKEETAHKDAEGCDGQPKNSIHNEGKGKGKGKGKGGNAHDGCVVSVSLAVFEDGLRTETIVQGYYDSRSHHTKRDESTSEEGATPCTGEHTFDISNTSAETCCTKSKEVPQAFAKDGETEDKKKRFNGIADDEGANHAKKYVFVMKVCNMAFERGQHAEEDLKRLFAYVEQYLLPKSVAELKDLCAAVSSSMMVMTGGRSALTNADVELVLASGLRRRRDQNTFGLGLDEKASNVDESTNENENANVEKDTNVGGDFSLSPLAYFCRVTKMASRDAMFTNDGVPAKQRFFVVETNFPLLNELLHLSDVLFLADRHGFHVCRRETGGPVDVEEEESFFTSRRVPSINTMPPHHGDITPPPHYGHTTGLSHCYASASCSNSSTSHQYTTMHAPRPSFQKPQPQPLSSPSFYMYFRHYCSELRRTSQKKRHLQTKGFPSTPLQFDTMSVSLLSFSPSSMSSSRSPSCFGPHRQDLLRERHTKPSHTSTVISTLSSPTHDVCGPRGPIRLPLHYRPQEGNEDVSSGWATRLSSQRDHSYPTTTNTKMHNNATTNNNNSKHNSTYANHKDYGYRGAPSSGGPLSSSSSSSLAPASLPIMYPKSCYYGPDTSSSFNNEAITTGTLPYHDYYYYMYNNCCEPALLREDVQQQQSVGIRNSGAGKGHGAVGGANVGFVNTDISGKDQSSWAGELSFPSSPHAAEGHAYSHSQSDRQRHASSAFLVGGSELLSSQELFLSNPQCFINPSRYHQLTTTGSAGKTEDKEGKEDDKAKERVDCCCDPALAQLLSSLVATSSPSGKPHGQRSVGACTRGAKDEEGSEVFEVTTDQIVASSTTHCSNGRNTKEGFEEKEVGSTKVVDGITSSSSSSSSSSSCPMIGTKEKKEKVVKDEKGDVAVPVNEVSRTEGRSGAIVNNTCRYEGDHKEGEEEDEDEEVDELRLLLITALSD